MIKFSSTTQCDVTCACVLPFARDGACPATFACLIGRAGAGLGLPCKHMQSRGGGLLAASAHSRHQWRRKTPVRCFSTPPLTRKAALATLRLPSAAQRLHSIRNPASEGIKVAEIFESLRTCNFQNSVSPEEQRRADTPPAFGPVFVRPARRLPRVISGPSVAGCPVATFRPKG